MRKCAGKQSLDEEKVGSKTSTVKSLYLKIVSFFKEQLKYLMSLTFPPCLQGIGLQLKFRDGSF